MTATYDGRLWTPCNEFGDGYGAIGRSADGDVIDVNIGETRGDTPEQRLHRALTFVHLANGLTRTEIRVLNAYRAIYAETGDTQPTQAQLAARAGCSQQMTGFVQARLAPLGYLVRRGGDGARFRYDLAPTWR